MLFVSGVGDETGEPPHDRTTAWLTSKPGNRTLLWSSDPRVKHESMTAYQNDGKIRGPACARIKNVVVAWLDAVVHQRRQAIDWLASDAVHELSGGTHELHRR